MRKFITNQCQDMTAAVDMIGFIQLSDDGKSINTTSLNLLQLVQNNNAYEPVILDGMIAAYETEEQARKAYDMFLKWLNSDTGNTVFVFPTWDEEINDFNPSWNDQHVMDGYIPTSDDKERRREWEDTIKETLMDTSKNGFGFSRQEADHVMKEIQNMDVKTASEFLESQYGYYNAIYAYEDLEIHKGTAEEINHYIERKLSEHSFSWYFAKKFTDFAGLHMAFFATVLLSFLFIQDTRKNTYELLHTKPVTAIQYICGKVISGFISMLGVLVILNVIFFMLCLKTSLESGFPVTPIDFCVNSLIYIVPNLLMICCVYTITAVIFKNPLPAAPILFLHIIYSNMLTMKNDIYYMRPFSIMVRFPGRFFETHAAKMSNINQIILVISSVILVCISVTIWKRRRVH